MEIIDAQVHEPMPTAPWPLDEASRTLLSVELAREAIDCVGVDAALLQASVPFCAAAMQRYPARFAGCPMAEPPEGVAALDHLQTLLRTPGILAVRTVVRSFVDGQLTPAFKGGAYEPIYSAARAVGLPVFIQAAGHLPAIRPLIERHSDVLFILDHCGLNQHPSVVAADPWADIADVVAMARYSNVALKMSGAITLARTPYPFVDVWPPLLKLIAAFGPERVMWGSDFTRLRYAPRSTGIRGPRSGWFGLYSDSLNYVRDTNELSSNDKALILGGSLKRLLRWDRPSE